MSSTKKVKHDKPGQPTKYRPEYCQMLIEHMKSAHSFETFACEVGVNKDTLYEWCKAHAEFSEAKKIGRLHMQKSLENIGKGLMTGKIKGNVAAWIFYAKNTIGWNDDANPRDEDYDDWSIE